jgi:hypothetical protein
VCVVYVEQVSKTPTYAILLVDGEVNTEREEERSGERARKGLCVFPVRFCLQGAYKIVTRTMPIRCLNRVVAHPAAVHTAMIIQFRPIGLKRSPSRIRTTRIPTDIPPRMLKAISPGRRQSLNRPPREPSAKMPKVTSVRMRSGRPCAFIVLIIATQATSRMSVAAI